LFKLTKRFGEPETVKEILDKLDSTNNLQASNSNGENGVVDDEESVAEDKATSQLAPNCSRLSNDTENTTETPAVPNPSECFNFQILETAPITHKYHLTVFQTINAQHFYKSVQKEHKLLRTSLPPGVHVRTFEDRLDLLSIMIEGPKNTPYENGLFYFDIQMGREYPNTPPLCHYISFCSDRLNPNLYEDGKVCVSLLGTWSGRGTEVWSSKNSTLLQVIVSIQGLILVDEPYFNEAGYEKQRGESQNCKSQKT
jgi:ubiquitin-conjugating enzyme E2 O